MKRILVLILTMVLLAGCTSAAAAAEAQTDAPPVEMKTYPFYLGSPAALVSTEFPLYFVNGVDDLPYMEINDLVQMMNMLYPAVGGALYAGFQVSVKTDEDAQTVILMRENESVMICNFEQDTIFWDDYVGFFREHSGHYMNVAAVPETDAQGQPFLLQAVDSRSRRGNNILLDLADYQIPMIVSDGRYLIPMQTLSGFCLTPLQSALYFNGESAIFAPVAAMSTELDNPRKILERLGLLTEEIMNEAWTKYSTEEERRTYYLEVLGQSEAGQKALEELNAEYDASIYKLFVSGLSGERSDEFAIYGYNELCLELDSLYGVKESHHINDFASYFSQTGLTLDLLSTSMVDADNAVFRLVTNWLDDGHSKTISRSFRPESGPEETAETYGYSMSALDDAENKITWIRVGYPEAQLPYYEVGNTAFVTFDAFEIDTRADYYALAEAGELPDDTISLIIKAHKEITRENSPIENVVIDLSRNGGGAAIAAAYVLCWFLGDAQISTRNTFTGAESTIVYRADVNLDHQFDDADTVSDLNLYCLVSSFSFSCGNLVPWAFKSDGRVTLLGKVSGGGSCAVQTMTTAWGTSYRISGPLQLSFVKNGAYYDVDQGAEPDYFIRDYHHFFDRETLTEFINGLY